MRPAALVLIPASLAITAPAAAQMPAPPRALVDTYCVTCHNERTRSGEFVLDPATAEQPGQFPEVWEKVVRKLRSGTMPPPGARRPPTQQVGAAAAWLEQRLDGFAAARPNPGTVVLHRLNRAEYANAIRDLLALDVSAAELLPPDDSGYGFDNIADVLTVSPGLFERYLSAARKIARDAVADTTTTRPVIVTLAKLPMFQVQSDRMGEQLPFGSRGGVAVRHHVPVSGEYVLRINFHRGLMSGIIRGLQDDNDVDVRVDGQRVTVLRLARTARGMGYSDGTLEEPLKVQLALTAGPHTIAVALRKVTTAYEGWGPASMPVASNSFGQTDRMNDESGRVEVSVERLDLEGPFRPVAPFTTPSRERIFTCAEQTGRVAQVGRVGEGEACATQVLTRLAYRAYRRPVTKQDVQTLLEFYRKGLGEDRSFERGIQFALERLLIDPDFLFRAERSGAFALASRLSFFLWSSIPDERLLDAAARGTLQRPAVLDAEIARMLADPRARALVENFFGQWLMLRNMKALERDFTVFPAFDDNLRQGLRTETELFLESQLREDRGIGELLTARHTYVNERVASHYGMRGIYGSHFRRVPVTDPSRVGLLGHGSILAVTSYANRTSPVTRGKWLMQNILGVPAPLPPANVPPLEETKVSGTLRQRMEQHRKNPVCSGCHSQLDPLGFALENFDATGKWRTVEASHPIDASGALPDGSTFSGPESFRAALASREEQFIATVAEKLLTYALGRGVEAPDMPAVRAIVRGAAASDYRWSAVISGIVRSVPFQGKTP